MVRDWSPGRLGADGEVAETLFVSDTKRVGKGLMAVCKGFARGLESLSIKVAEADADHTVLQRTCGNEGLGNLHQGSSILFIRAGRCNRYRWNALFVSTLLLF